MAQINEKNIHDQVPVDSSASGESVKIDVGPKMKNGKIPPPLLQQALDGLLTGADFGDCLAAIGFPQGEIEIIFNEMKPKKRRPTKHWQGVVDKYEAYSSSYRVSAAKKLSGSESGLKFLLIENHNYGVKKPKRPKGPKLVEG